jgi:hypothetical protein
MSPPKLKVSRAGNILGDFTREEILKGIQNGTFSPEDYFWDPENKSAGWQRLSDLPKEPEPPKPSASNPPAVPPQPSSAQAGATEKPVNAASKNAEENPSGRSSLGVFIILVGMFIAFIGIIGDPEGSAIRQGVLSQMITNGLLVMIFGLIFARK